LQLHRLTDDQAFTLKAALSGHNVFVTGQAGTAFLVKEIFQQLEQSGKNVAIISSTGILSTLYTDLKNPVPTVIYRGSYWSKKRRLMTSSKNS